MHHHGLQFLHGVDVASEVDLGDAVLDDIPETGILIHDGLERAHRQDKHFRVIDADRVQPGELQ